ncbi:hypothetical protein [Frankia sp. EAN1pec]|uniref:hypothetical protein n=1 Tax=Parafrankia sp. (strain EAN1pec) TaxID=298653 RepID=UPI0018DC6FF8
MSEPSGARQSRSGEQRTRAADPLRTKPARSPHPSADRPGNLLALQTLAGNAAVTDLIEAAGPPGVARWTGPISFQSQASLLDEARKGSYNAVIQLDEATLAGADDNDRLKWIDQVNDSTLVVLRASRALERIWRSFGSRFLEVAGANPDNLARWRRSCARHTGLPEQVPQAADLQGAWLRDIRTIGGGCLDTNEEFARNKLQQFGASESGDTMAAPTDEQANALSQLQTAAEGLAALRWGQETARQMYVGYVDYLPPAGSMQDAHHYRRVRFDPTAAPPLTRIERDRERPAYLYRELTETEELVSDDADPNALAPVQSYEDARRKYDEAEAAASVTLSIYPELFAFSGSQSDAGLGQFAVAQSSSAARQQLVTGLRTMLSHIRATRQQLGPGGGLDPLDLTPIHRRLLRGEITASSGTDWTRPFAREVAGNLVQGHNVDIALHRLGLQLIAEAAFLFAPATGGLTAVAALTLATGASAGNVALDASRYAALADAAASAARPGTALVDRRTVDDARMATESEAIALALAALALGAAAAAGALRAWRARQTPPPEQPPPAQPPSGGRPAQQGNAPQQGGQQGAPQPGTPQAGATEQGAPQQGNAPQQPPDPAAAVVAQAQAQTQAARAAFAAEIGIDAGTLAGFTEEEINRLRQLLPNRHPSRIAGLRNYLSEQVSRGRHTRNILRTLEEMEPRERARYLDRRAAIRWNPDWRGRDPAPRLEVGNADEGWTHIDARHVTGNAAGGAGDLFAPGTTRQQIFEAAVEVIERGNRVSARGQRITTFERSLYVNGRRDAIRVTVDTSDGRIITVFPVRGGGP